MPFRDHFHPPISKRGSWEGFHGGWPMNIVRELNPRLPDGYVAEPRAHLGSFYEIDVCAFETTDNPERGAVTDQSSYGQQAGAVAAQTAQASTSPMLTLEAEFPDEYAYEVLIFDMERERQLVAAVEIVSPANKDRPESRRLFVDKCFNLLRQDVCVSIIDLVTIRRFNLYAELLALLNLSDPTCAVPPPPTYAVTCRKRRSERPPSGQGKQGLIPNPASAMLDIWSRPIALGQPLPSLPIWLTDSLTVELNLEVSYEETCRLLRLIR